MPNFTPPRKSIRNACRQVLLKFPHDGPSGTTSATVWHTALDLGADVMEPTGQVRVNGRERFPSVDAVCQRPAADDFGYFRHGAASSAPLSAACTYQVETWCPEPTS